MHHIASGLNVSYVELDDCRGQCWTSLGKIEIDNRLSDEGKFKTLCHEIFHFFYYQIYERSYSDGGYCYPYRSRTVSGERDSNLEMIMDWGVYYMMNDISGLKFLKRNYSKELFDDARRIILGLIRSRRKYI